VPAKAPATTEAPETPETVTTLTGLLTAATDADGDADYSIKKVRVSVGPPWFWGDKHPLAGLVGTSVTVTGYMETSTSTKASDKAKDTGPEFEVLSVNGKAVRDQGKPPWAGGPKAVGASHPGYAGWSKAKGNSATP